MSGIDVLMITYRWPRYVEQTLPRLLATCTDDMRVWLWHNGDDDATLRVTRSYADHPRVARFHHSPDNQRLTAPTNWLWEHAEGELLGKVDDDCLVSDGWAQTLQRAHADEPEFGAIGSWRFYDEDFVPEVAHRKIRTFRGGHQLLCNPWIQGSGYLMKRRCVEHAGPLEPGESFTSYCVELAAAGYTNGWYFPFVHEDHLDDPRSANTGLITDADFRDRLPLSAQWRGITTIEQWEEENRRSAYSVQAAHPDPRHYRGWRKTARRVRGRIERKLRRPGAVIYSGANVPRMPGAPPFERLSATDGSR